MLPTSLAVSGRTRLGLEAALIALGFLLGGDAFGALGPGQLDLLVEQVGRPDVAERVRETSLRVFEVLECAGLARVDSFVTDDGDIYVNEINTLPGFTNISMYTKLWEASGLSQTDLIDELLRLAIERHAAESALRTSR